MYKKVILFQGAGRNGGGLFESDGTAAGTVEISQQGAGYITPIGNGKILFTGSNRGLWVTDGTARGTHELKKIKYANYQGVFPAPTIAYKGEMIFSGDDNTGNVGANGLWISDGTVAGTQEIGGRGNKGIKDVYRPGEDYFNANAFVLFRGEVMFEGSDSQGHLDLWLTDGTAAGTKPLENVKGQFQGGLDPNDITVLGKEAYLTGADQTDTGHGLWKSDGTVAGTVEIGGQLNKGVKGVDPGMGLNPEDLTAFSHEVFFVGQDNTRSANGNLVHTQGLWVTDGSAGGTHEVTGIKGANGQRAGGIFDGIANPDFTAYDGKLYFAGRDADSRVGLWVTDGTAKGTREIGGLDNGGVKGAYFGGLLSTDPNFVVYGNKLYFAGHDNPNNRTELWVTDGTARGTHEITHHAAGNGLDPLGLVTATVRAANDAAPASRNQLAEALFDAALGTGPVDHTAPTPAADHSFASLAAHALTRHA